jgi:hypothetical protein
MMHHKYFNRRRGSTVGRILAVIALAATLSLLSTARAHAQISVGLGGGATFPLGTISNTYETGYNILADLALGEKSNPVNIRFDGMFNDLGAKSGFSIHSQQMWTLNANAVFNIGADTGKAVIPYIIGGVGYYNTSYNVSAVNTPSGETLTLTGNIHQNSLGLNAGLGLHVGKGKVSGFIEARYHYVFVGNHNFQFLPLTAGISLF